MFFPNDFIFYLNFKLSPIIEFLFQKHLHEDSLKVFMS